MCRADEVVLNIIVVMFNDDEFFSKSGLQPFLPSSFEGFDRLAL